MNESLFRISLIIMAAGFVLYALVFFFPPIIENPDIIGVLKAGFVNPYATAYSIDLIACWVVLIFWIFHERHTFQIEWGWICIPIGLILGVVVGLSLYLLIRMSHFTKQQAKDALPE